MKALKSGLIETYPETSTTIYKIVQKSMPNYCQWSVNEMK